MDRRFLRPGWLVGHVLVFLAFLTCLRLGWWQWDRTQEADGTAQNFGYALLWPAFGVAFIYMWVKFMRLEILKDVEQDEQTDRDLQALLDAGRSASDVPAEPIDGLPAVESDADATGGDENEPDDAGAESTAQRWRSDRQRPSHSVTISVATVQDDDDEDPELTAYNQALAALAEEDRRRAR